MIRDAIEPVEICRRRRSGARLAVVAPDAVPVQHRLHLTLEVELPQRPAPRGRRRFLFPVSRGLRYADGSGAGDSPGPTEEGRGHAARTGLLPAVGRHIRVSPETDEKELTWFPYGPRLDENRRIYLKMSLLYKPLWTKRKELRVHRRVSAGSRRRERNA
jgi:hypothetical protein